MLAFLLSLALLLQAAVQSQPPSDAAAVNSEPTVAAERLVDEGVALVGPDWRVDSPVPVRGFLGQFTIRSRWGPIEAQGRALLEIRIRELEALEKLDDLSSTRVFADAIASSAMATGAAVGRVVTRPVETIKGVPTGIGRLIRRTASSARKLAVTVGDTARRAVDDTPDEEPADGVDRAKDFANELAGVNRARRQLAREIGIDPYTGNPLIQQRLEKLAWASVAGGISMDLVMGQLGGSAVEMISASRKIDGLVWDLPPDDIRRRLEARLVERGVEPATARDFLGNRAFTPTLEVEFVEALEALNPPSGERELLLMAQTIQGEVHARFLIQQLRMLARHIPESNPVDELIAFDSSVGAISRDGDLWIMLPVDYLSWTESTRMVAETESGPSSRLIVSGRVEQSAQASLERAGWQVTSEAGVAD